jgi:16S rRNA processing protein RimM
VTAKRVRVAKIGAAHGLRGEVRLFVDADDPLAVIQLGALEDKSGARQFKIASLREAKDHLLVRFDGVNDRTAAELLTNLELFVPRERLPKQNEKDRFYQADLVGLRVETANGTSLGEVIAVANYGAGDLLEVKPVQGATFLVPFADPFVPRVDIEDGKVVVELPADFLEESGPHPSRRRAARGSSGCGSVEDRKQ